MTVPVTKLWTCAVSILSQGNSTSSSSGHQPPVHRFFTHSDLPFTAVETPSVLRERLLQSADWNSVRIKSVTFEQITRARIKWIFSLRLFRRLANPSLGYIVQTASVQGCGHLKGTYPLSLALTCFIVYIAELSELEFDLVINPTSILLLKMASSCLT